MWRTIPGAEHDVEGDTHRLRLRLVQKVAGHCQTQVHEPVPDEQHDRVQPAREESVHVGQGQPADVHAAHVGPRRAGQHTVTTT